MLLLVAVIVGAIGVQKGNYKLMFAFTGLIVFVFIFSAITQATENAKLDKSYELFASEFCRNTTTTVDCEERYARHSELQGFNSFTAMTVSIVSILTCGTCGFLHARELQYVSS